MSYHIFDARPENTDDGLTVLHLTCSNFEPYRVTGVAEERNGLVVVVIASSVTAQGQSLGVSRNERIYFNPGTGKASYDPSAVAPDHMRAFPAASEDFSWAV